MSHETNEAAKQPVTDCNHLGNAAKTREALLETQSVIAKCMDILNRIPDGVEYDGLIDDVADELCDLRESHVKPALAATPRNCDRPECATTKAAQDVWRKEDGGKTAYYEWLLAASTKGAKDTYKDERIKAKDEETGTLKSEIAELKKKCEEHERQPELMAETANAALKLLKSQDAKIAELRACLKMAVVNARIARTCYAFGRECDSCGQSCNARKWNQVIEATKGANHECK